MSPHPYSYNSGSESDERISVFYKLAWITLWLSVATYFCYAWIIQPRIDSLKDNGRLVGFLLTSPSALGVFYLLYKRTCHSWWRNRVWRSVVGISAPDLNGNWYGTSMTYYPNGEQKESINVELTVLQSWRDMIIGINGNFHKSDSMDASVLRVADGWIINFHYIAIRKFKKQEDSGLATVAFERYQETSCSGGDPLRHHTHIGSARLFISDKKKTESLKLQFFTEHARIGHMEFWKTNTERGETDATQEISTDNDLKRAQKNPPACPESFIQRGELEYPKQEQSEPSSMDAQR